MDHSSVSEEELTLLRDRLRDEYKNLFLVLDPQTGKPLYPVFQTLPLKKENRDYYALIKNPVSLNTLKKRLPNYTDAQSFVNDAMFVPWNAKKYYALGTQENSYSDILEDYMRTVMIPRLRSFYPELKLPILKPSAEEIMQQQRLLLQTPLNLLTQAQSATSTVPSIGVGGVSGSFTQAIPGNTTQAISPEQQAVTMVPPAVPFPGMLPSYGPPIASQSPFQQTTASSQTQSPNTSTVSLSGSPHVLLVSPRGTPHSHSSSSSSKKYVKRGRPPIIDLPHIQRMKNVLKYLKKDASVSQDFISSLEKNPDMAKEPDFYNIVSNSISLDEIWRKIKTRRYADFSGFQQDFELMLDNYKNYYRTTQKLDLLDQLILLEKSFNLLVTTELAKPDSDYIPEGEFRYPLNEVVVNGITYRIGDWVFLKNPNDAAKPIVGQIFKFWSTTSGEKWLNACWYFRPEQTVHRVDRLFYKNEVMKTGQYRDHLIEDLQGKCYVVHFTRYQRGDPAVKFEGPLFICEFRYNENDKVFNKIRTWKACLPEEIRDIDEKTIPVSGRKFFKYPSPIAHLLPANATYEDPIPEPQMGLPNAPPLVGAVYLRPRLLKDDLGEYSTSLELPRYVIKPGDPPEEGKIDYENGTIIVNKPLANVPSIPKSMRSPPKLTQPHVGGIQLTPMATGMDTAGVPSTAMTASTVSNAATETPATVATQLPPFPVPTSVPITTATPTTTSATAATAAITAATIMATAAITGGMKSTGVGENKVTTNGSNTASFVTSANSVPLAMSNNDNLAKQVFPSASFPLATSTTPLFKLQTGLPAGTTSHKPKRPSQSQSNIPNTVPPTSGTSVASTTPSFVLSTPKQLKPYQSKSRLQFIQSGTLPDNKPSNGTHADKTIAEILQVLRGKNNIPQIVADFPSAYVLPIRSHAKSYRIQRADLNNMARRYNREEFLKRRKEVNREELWFRGPSVSIVERIVPLGNRSLKPKLSLIMDHKHKRRIEYEEVEEIVDVDGTRSEVTVSPEEYGTKRRRFTLSENVDTDASTDEDKSNGDKSGLWSNSQPQVGLRPSTKFMAFLLSKGYGG